MEKRDSRKDADFLEKIRTHLVQIYGLEAMQVEELLQISSSTLDQSLEQAEQALADNDMTELSASAHKIKGVLLGAGLNREAEQALCIERSAREEKEAPYSQLLSDLRQSVQPLLQLPAENKEMLP